MKKEKKVKEKSERKKDNGQIEKAMKSTVLVLLVVSMLFPLVINGLMFIPYSITSHNLTPSDWLSFWGSYGGGLIGGIGALLSIYFTLKYYQKKDAEQQRLFKQTPLLEKIEFLKKQISNREIIKSEYTFGLLLPSEIENNIKEYNTLVAHLKGFFSEQAIETLIGVFQLKLKDENGEICTSYSTLNYFKLPPEIREYAEIIAELSLYENCTDLLCSDPRLAYIISVEQGGSAGMWPSWWHTHYLDRHEEEKSELKKLFSLVVKLLDFLDSEYRKRAELIYENKDWHS